MAKRFFYKEKKSYNSFQSTMTQLADNDFSKVKKTLEQFQFNKQQISLILSMISDINLDNQAVEECVENIKKLKEFQKSDLTQFIIQNYEHFELKYDGLIRMYNQIDTEIRYKREDFYHRSAEFMFTMGFPTLLSLIFVIMSGLGTSPVLVVPAALLIITLLPPMIIYFLRYSKSLESKAIRQIVEDNSKVGYTADKFKYTEDLTLKTFDEKFDQAIQNCIEEAKQTLSDKALEEQSRTFSM